LPSTRAEVSSAHHFAAAHRRGDGLGGSGQRRPGTGQHVGNRALADADTEHFVEQPHQPLEADRLEQDGDGGWRIALEATS
jgi:hypothetical protein